MTGFGVYQANACQRPLMEVGIEVEGRPTSWRRGQSVEGGGKRRIFAIGIWVTQRLLAPLLISG